MQWNFRNFGVDSLLLQKRQIDKYSPNARLELIICFQKWDYDWLHPRAHFQLVQSRTNGKFWTQHVYSSWQPRYRIHLHKSATFRSQNNQSSSRPHYSQQHNLNRHQRTKLWDKTINQYNFNKRNPSRRSAINNPAH